MHAVGYRVLLNVPPGHTAHGSLPAVALNVPLSQLAHTSAPSLGECRPAGQGSHAPCPSEPWYVPAVQFEQADAPVAAENVPVRQGNGAVIPAEGQLVPTGQAGHSLGVPADGAYRPGGQRVHSMAPSGDELPGSQGCAILGSKQWNPAGHTVHSEVLNPGEYVPLAQGVQSRCPPAENVPGSQGTTHVAFAGSGQAYPGGQGVHTALPEVRVTVPGSQGSHASREVCASFELNVPSGHASFSAADSQKCPTGHARQVADPGGLYCPSAGQLSHCSCDVAPAYPTFFPAGHSWHPAVPSE